MNIITGKVGESLLSQNVGGKAAQLFLLKKHGLNIPQFVVILPDAFSFENNNDSIKVIDDFIFPKNTIDDILKHFDKDTFFFAVRSSATAEDGIVNSFAGQDRICVSFAV